LYINIKAPEPETPSMTMALEKYLQVSNKEWTRKLVFKVLKFVLKDNLQVVFS
jgi:hypothetical protein